MRVAGSIDQSKFDIVRNTGAGAHSVVQLRKRKIDGCLFVAKIINSLKPRESDSVSREIDAALKLDHPCVVRGLAYSLPKKVGDPTILLLEFVPGGTLDYANVDPTKKTLVVISLLKALQFLHS
jgi:serine/threonine protein kinase